MHPFMKSISESLSKCREQALNHSIKKLYLCVLNLGFGSGAR